MRRHLSAGQSASYPAKPCGSLLPALEILRHIPLNNGHMISRVNPRQILGRFFPIVNDATDGYVGVAPVGCFAPGPRAKSWNFTYRFSDHHETG